MSEELCCENVTVPVLRFDVAAMTPPPPKRRRWARLAPRYLPQQPAYILPSAHQFLR